jgi:hypothetical protein
MTILSPSNLPRRIKSRKLVQTFIESNEQKSVVNVEETGRDKTNVYVSLNQYLSKHPEFGVGVQLEDGNIILYRSVD